MADNTPPKSGRPTYSCVRCAERKVKCDRRDPCNMCVKHETPCRYRESQASRKQLQRVRQHHLKERLHQCEALLKGQTCDETRRTSATHKDHNRRALSVDQGTTLQLPRQSSPVPSRSKSINKTQLLDGRGRLTFVDKYDCLHATGRLR